MRESEWLRIPHPSAKIIDDATHACVPQHLATFTINKSDDRLVDELRSILAMHERLIPTTIRRTPGVCSELYFSSLFRHRFGYRMLIS